MFFIKISTKLVSKRVFFHSLTLKKSNNYVFEPRDHSERFFFFFFRGVGRTCLPKECLTATSPTRPSPRFASLLHRLDAVIINSICFAIVNVGANLIINRDNENEYSNPAEEVKSSV